MKILYLSGGDYFEIAADLLYNGIVELFGHDNVVDYPYIENGIV